MTTYQAYQHQLSRLTPEQLIQLNVKEKNIGRQLGAWEIVGLFKLEPSEKKPVRRRLSEEVDNHWSDQ